MVICDRAFRSVDGHYKWMVFFPIEFSMQNDYFAYEYIKHTMLWCCAVSE